MPATAEQITAAAAAAAVASTRRRTAAAADAAAPIYYGQQISFASEIDPDESYSAYIWLRAKRGDTCQSLAASRGHPEAAAEIATLNSVRSVTKLLRVGERIRIPGTFKQGDQFSVFPQDMMRPQITDGYAMYQVVARPGRIGINQFIGYDPVSMVMPVEFRAVDVTDGAAVETAIETLERMAGRGSYAGAASGAPSVIRISVTDTKGAVVPLIASAYQWSRQNPSAPLWRIGGGSATGGGIDWDGSPTSDSKGRRVLQKATITVSQYTPISLAERSATRRSKSRNTKKKT